MNVVLPKVRAPRPTQGQVTRDRLIRQLDEGFGVKLTVISAPAGFGKTTLLAQWLETSQAADFIYAWVSLDFADNDAVRLIHHCILAIGQAQPGLADSLLSTSRSLSESSLPTFLAQLVNELDTTRSDLVLVLDDFHVLKSESALEAVRFLIANLPESMHVVIATRDQPTSLTGRLRAQGELVEIGTDDLRFTSGESSEFFAHTLRSELTLDEVEILARRTEGWVVALRLAALAMKDRDDTSGFVTRFAGTHRYITDYLGAEVLSAQPQELQSFLLETSVLDRLSGPICDAVTGRSGSQRQLEGLEQDGLFTVSLDDERRWFRYHHLFADFLLDRLHTASPELIPELRRRASEWLEANDMVPEAIEYAIDANDFSRAARLIEEVGGSTWRRGESRTVLRWLDELPKEIVDQRPELYSIKATALLLSGAVDVLGPLIDAAPAGVDSVELTVAKAIVACYRGQVSQSIDLSIRALEELPEDDLVLRSLVVINLALNLGSGHGSEQGLSDARSTLQRLAADAQRTNNTHAAIHALGFLGRLESSAGLLHEAQGNFREVIRIATGPDAKPLPVACVAIVGMGELLREWNDLETAASQLAQGTELAAEERMFTIVVEGKIALARVMWALGNEAAAIRVLDEAEEVAGRHGLDPLGQRAAGYRVRFDMHRGDLGRAAEWAAASDVGVGSELGFWGEGAHTTLARVLMAQERYEEALELLDWLFDTTERIGLHRSALEALVTKALALDAMSEGEAALQCLEKALSLAEDEGYVRLFVDEGRPMVSLLQKAAGRGVFPRLVTRLLLAAAGSEIDTVGQDVQARRQGAVSSPTSTGGLTRRELEVLHLIAVGASNQQIADALVVSLSTVKTHINNVYTKLHVRSRLQAVTAAREHGIL